MDKQEFLDNFRSLSPEWQSTILWVMQHIDLMEWLTREPYSEETLQADLEKMRKRKDYLGEAMLLYQRAADRDRKKT